MVRQQDETVLAPPEVRRCPTCQVGISTTRPGDLDPEMARHLRDDHRLILAPRVRRPRVTARVVAVWLALAAAAWAPAWGALLWNAVR